MRTIKSLILGAFTTEIMQALRKIMPNANRFALANTGALRKLGAIALLLLLMASVNFVPRAWAQSWDAQNAPCAVAYKVTGQWQDKFTAQITLKNLSARLDGWTLHWIFPGGQTITQFANGEYTQSDAVVTVTNSAWNRILRTNQKTIMAFHANSGSAHPTQFMLNGMQCDFEAVNLTPVFWRP
ncbi:MAG: cellulose binding domain-containing protein [Caldilineaceae bacterium]|nr:cellulose binding domain-containing protein [Caldilineaceae bacterium]